jgi:predicted nucleotidyltransferase component of viral defense system
MDPAHRYSEDIDLVQIRAEPIGAALDAIREVLDPWLGNPSWRQSHARVKLTYRIGLGRDSTAQRRIKLEIHTREHEAVYGYHTRVLAVASRWFEGKADVTSYELDELLATKLRALYQRKKGRDLFDLAFARRLADVNPGRVVEGLVRYLEWEGMRISQAEFEANLSAKLLDADFLADILSLVAYGTQYDPAEAAVRVRADFIARLP